MSRRLRIWLIKVGEPSPLEKGARVLRTGMLAHELAARGHDVLWWTSAYEHFQKRWIVEKDSESRLAEGLTVKFLKGVGYRRNVSLARILDHRLLCFKFRRMAARMPKPDLIVASMPPHDLADTAVAFARERDIPVLVDIRDPWPDLFVEQLPRWLRPISRWILFNDFRMIRRTMRRATGIIAVSRAFLKWGLAYAGRAAGPSDRVFYLGSRRSPERTEASASNKIAPLLPRIEGKLVVSFYGLFGHINDATTVVRSARLLAESGWGSKIVFVLAGEGEFLEQVRREAQGLDHVFFPGWVNEEEIATLVRHSHLGICSASRKLDLFQNKAFAYLAAGVPVLNSFYGDLKDWIEERGIGLFFAPGDSAALAACIERVARDPALQPRMSKNAQALYEEAFDADPIYRNYANLIEEIALKTP